MRIQSIDFIRVVAIISVITIHSGQTELLAPTSELDFSIIVNQLARFAVPFFFVISGYFFAQKLTFGQAGKAGIETCYRIAKLYIFWSIIYLIYTFIEIRIQRTELSLIQCLKNSLYTLRPFENIFFEGTKTHLWFLPALISCIVITVAFAKVDLKFLCGIAIIFYIVALLGKPYSVTPIGFSIAMNLRDGPFFGLIFFVTGQVFYRWGPKPSWFAWGILTALLGTLLHFSEINFLHGNFESTWKQDFVVGTYLMGAGVSMMALSNSPLLRLYAFSTIGPVVLGVYAIHYLFIDGFKLIMKNFFHSFHNFQSGLIEIIFVFLLSIFFAILLSKFRLTKILVS